MSISVADFALEYYGPDHKLLEALVKDSEEEWMKILRERRNDVIGMPLCPFICVLKRWTVALNMMANFQRPIFIHNLSWEKSILYQYIRSDAFAASAERKWQELAFSTIALIIAIREGYTEDVRDLLKFATLPNHTYWSGRSMLLEAVLSRNIETVRALIDGGSEDYFVEGYAMTAAAQAAELGELEMMREIGWSANDDLVLERGVCGSNMKVVNAIMAARTEKFNLKRISRLTKNEFLRKLLSEANAALPERTSTSTIWRWRWFSA